MRPTAARVLAKLRIIRLFVLALKATSFEAVNVWILMNVLPMFVILLPYVRTHQEVSHAAVHRVLLERAFEVNLDVVVLKNASLMSTVLNLLFVGMENVAMLVRTLVERMQNATP